MECRVTPIVILLCVWSLTALACGGGERSPTVPASPGAAATPPSAGASAAPPAAQNATQDPPLSDDRSPGLLNPSLATATAPEVFRVEFTTSKGTFVVKVVRDGAPRGADRFYNLVKVGFYDSCTFYRTVDGF
ncbi:MAG: peptidylprolyl isomerase, partial [Myxococcota bacterium]